MQFNSIEYLLFLPIVFIIYWFVAYKSLKIQNLFIVIASYIFYGWWNWRFLVLIAFTTFCSYMSGVLMTHQKGAVTRKAICTTNIVVNLLILGIFKYYNFFIESFAYIFGFTSDRFLLNLILPVGISFYTFQALSYSIDVYKQKIKATNDAIAFFAYVSFFPQLVAGPIERATNLLPQFQKTRTFDYSTAVDGLRQILWGLFKKVVIADNCATYVDEVFNNFSQHTGSALAIGGILFALQIYGDFSGYSDMAIGTSKLFGIFLKDNFKTPYFSRDIPEFWRRWHISLNKWFVDYVYIPMGGSRVSKPKIIRNVFVIFLLSGLWHGANWTYVTWGAYHAFLFLPMILSNNNKRYTNIVAADRHFPKISEVGQMLVTFIFVVIGWIIFRADSIISAIHIFGKIFSAELFSRPSYLWDKDYRLATVISICICFFMEWINRKYKHGLDIAHFNKAFMRIILYYVLLAFIVLYSGRNITFIYFQF